MDEADELEHAVMGMWICDQATGGFGLAFTALNWYPLPSYNDTYSPVDRQCCRW